MKGLSKIIGMVGILLAVYSVIGRFVYQPTIGFGLAPLSATAGLVASANVMLISIVVRLWEK